MSPKTRILAAFAVISLGAAVAYAAVDPFIWEAFTGEEVRLTMVDGGTKDGRLLLARDGWFVIKESSGAPFKGAIEDVTQIVGAPSDKPPPDLRTPIVVCSLNGNVSPQISGDVPAAEVRTAVQDLARQIGMRDVPDIVVAPNVPNALATIYQGRKVIAYNPEFMAHLQRDSSRNAVISVLAHELGHHVNNHMVVQTGGSWAAELSADFYSGFAMAKRGAPLKDALEAIEWLGERFGTGGTDTHPPTHLRLDEIKKGFLDGGGIVDPACSPSCAGKQCGNDGCGGTCGSCNAGSACDQNGQCTISGGCERNCLGRMCGSDGCGGTCGSCVQGFNCNGSGQCVPQVDPRAQCVQQCQVQAIQADRALAQSIQVRMQQVTQVQCGGVMQQCQFTRHPQVCWQAQACMAQVNQAGQLEYAQGQQLIQGQFQQCVQRCGGAL